MSDTVRSAAVRIYAHGGPEVLRYEEIQVAAPGFGEVRIRQGAIGLNFTDIDQRVGKRGARDVGSFPITLGVQGAGVVDAVGTGVEDIRVGDVVGCRYPGAYSTFRLVPAGSIVPLPPELSVELAAASLLRGMTAEYLLNRLYAVRAGETILVHAAAGGMGEIVCQWARALGARVIGTVGSDAKREIALQYGCHEVINYSTEDFVARTLAITQREGVSVVYDAVGKSVFLRSLDCLRTHGWLISYGAASGSVGAFDLQLLHRKSLVVTRPSLRSFIATPESFRTSARAFFDIVKGGSVRLAVSRRYALADVVQAHRDIEARSTTGASILVPSAV